MPLGNTERYASTWRSASPASPLARARFAWSIAEISAERVEPGEEGCALGAWTIAVAGAAATEVCGFAMGASVFGDVWGNEGGNEGAVGITSGGGGGEVRVGTGAGSCRARSAGAAAGRLRDSGTTVAGTAMIAFAAT